MSDAAPDPAIVDAVRSVRDRFGADGLRDLILLARDELGTTERAAAELSAEEG